MTNVDFIFDFGSPNAYLAHRVVPKIAERTGATFTYLPVLLGGVFKATGNQPPLVTYGNIKSKLDYEQTDMRRFMDKHAITKFTFNPNFPVITLLAMRGAIAAEEDGRLADYVEAGFVAMWEAGEKMDDPAVFAEVMSAAGFDGEGLIARAQDPVVKAKLAENTQDAVERGVFGAPTFFVGDEMYFGKDRLDWVEEAIVAAA